MFSQSRLLDQIDTELRNEEGLYSLYEKYCKGLTLEDLFTSDTVYIASKRCASGFMRKNDTWQYQSSAWVNSLKLCQKVLNGSFTPHYYKTRTIMERGKPRVIKPPVYECKVVQKVICDYVIRPLLQPKMISTSYASITGRGTGKLYEDIEEALNKNLSADREMFIVTSDFTNYFANIDINILIEDMLARFIKDRRLLDLIRKFSPEDLGLSLGNELSQVPASFYPSPLDHRVKDFHGWTYFRYMDDSIAVIPKRDIDDYLSVIREYSHRLNICLKEEKIRVFPIRTPFIFCKERFLWNRDKQRYYRLMNPAIEKNEKRKLKAFGEKLECGKMSIESINLQYKSVMGVIASHPNTARARGRLARTYRKQIIKEAV